jgi:outer membrane lipoprotein carrier protein
MFKSFIISLFTAFLSVLFLFTPSIQASHPEQEVENLQKKYQSTNSISFDFKQQTSTSGRLREADGNALFLRKNTQNKKSNIIRWNYLSPSKQIILNDGEQLSLYTAQDKQLIVTSSDQLESDITYGIFSGTIKILDAFIISKFQGQSQSDNQSSELALIPREPHGQIQRLHLWYTQDYVINKLLMEDHFGSVTILLFSNIALDTIAPDDQNLISSILDLNLPEDTEIIRQ